MRILTFLFLLFSLSGKGQTNISCDGSNAIRTTQDYYCLNQNVYIDDWLYCNDPNEEETFKWLIITDSRDTIDVNLEHLSSIDHYFDEGNYQVCRLLFRNGIFINTSSAVSFEVIDCTQFTDTSIVETIDTIYYVDTLGWTTTIVNCDNTTDLVDLVDITELCNILPVSPNPSSDCVTIDIQLRETPTSITYQIYDINGTVVREGVYNDDLYCDFENGVYYFTATLVFNGIDYIVTSKFIIK